MRSLAICFTVLACAIAAPAHAQSKRAVEKPDWVGAGQATSSCIGATTSPVCATETLLACFARANAELCAKIGVAPRAGGREPGPIEYIIDRVSVIRTEDITEELRELDWFKAGYTLIELRRRGCATGDCGNESWEDMQVYLRPQGEAWAIVAWRGIEQEGAPEEPENFRTTGGSQ
jgi:hypothetical protein